ncbi:MAG TPA: ATP-binding protein, partial [Candidatus Polarisedimenticolia bacterium]|nr:ATP-binding protein [Candidatus Polarisedimenticolia bacterium]
MSFEGRILGLALLTGCFGTIAALALVWTGDFTPKVQWTLTTFLGILWLSFAFHLRQRIVMPLQTLSNLLAALREEDFSIRARGARRGDALGDVMIEVNALAETLHHERLGALEAGALLRKIMLEIDVAVFAFDPEGRVRLANRAAEKLLAQPAERLIGRSASELGLEECLTEDSPGTFERSFPGGSGRWEARRSLFRQGGLPLQMLVITDLSRALREEERQAWQRLIRVLGHELNNSLAPIQSIAGSLVNLMDRRPAPADRDEDLKRGLAVIAARSEALNRFMDGYARLARLPRPVLRSVDLGALIRRVAGLEIRKIVSVDPGPDMMVRADADQLEQLLINLVRNAVDAALETGGAVRVGWGRNGDHFDLWVEDEGPGLSNTSNLFVPFFTTKAGGSGIGLVLSRQIAEAHRGTLVV